MQPALLLHAGPICQGWLSELQRGDEPHRDARQVCGQCHTVGADIFLAQIWIV